MTSRLTGKTALVTGSTSNIGKAIAIALADEGAQVVVSGRDPGRGAEVVAEIGSRGGRATFVAADINGARAASHQLAQEAIAALGGRLDILVNNAGVYPTALTTDADEDVFDLMYGVNVKAPFFLTQAVLPTMVEAGGGVIINLSSWVVRLGSGAGALYSSTKGAMETLTRAWSSEFADRGIRVNAISPGVILEGGHDPASPLAVMMAGTPAGVIGTPEAVAKAAVYLASEDSSFVHGTVLDVDGGRANVAVVANC